jgi:isoquinoline 1-oxidoreductase subunit beta
VKIGADNRVTAIVPHSDMGQGAQSALAQMLADELDARWEDVSVLEAPGRRRLRQLRPGQRVRHGGLRSPVLVPTVDGAMLRISDFMHLQITGGSMSVRTTGVYGMRVAGCRAKDLLLDAAAAAWQVPGPAHRRRRPGPPRGQRPQRSPIDSSPRRRPAHCRRRRPPT